LSVRTNGVANACDDYKQKTYCVSRRYRFFQMDFRFVFSSEFGYSMVHRTSIVRADASKEIQ
jgi:hypothetical protein